MMRWRPSILLAVGVLAAIALVALFLEAADAIVTGCSGGIIALGMRLLEGNSSSAG